MTKQHKVVAYCKACRQPRLIINDLCPGCMKRGTIVFDTDVDIIKEMMERKRHRR